MTQKPQKPRRTALRPNSQQGVNQPAQPAFQQPMSSAPQQSMPQQTSSERIVVVQRASGNPVGAFMNFITWPFRKVVAAVLWLVRVIIAAMLRSVISFIIGIIMLIILAILIGVFGFALVDSHMDFIQAFSLSAERIVHFFQTFVSFQQTAESIQNSIPTQAP